MRAIFVILAVFINIQQAYSYIGGRPSSSNNFIYNCPYVDDLIYERGVFSAKTNYGIPISWYSARSFPEKKLTAKFFRVNRSSCVGGVCQIDCVYKLSNDYMAFLFIVRNQYESEEVVPGNWGSDDSTCIDSNPDNCKFYLSEHLY